MATNKKLLVSLIARNRPEYTERTINSIRSYTYLGNDRPVISVWHNGPMTEYMENYLKAAENTGIKVHYSKEDIGWGAAHNKNLEQYDLDDYEYILMSDNDVLYKPDWFNKLKDLLDKYPQIGVLAVWKHIYHGLLGKQYYDLVVKDQMPGCGWLFKTSRLKELLPVPEKGPYLGRGGVGEDVTFCNIARDQKGYLIAGPVEDVAEHIDGY